MLRRCARGGEGVKAILTMSKSKKIFSPDTFPCPKVYQNMFRCKPRATLGLIFFTVLFQEPEKQ